MGEIPAADETLTMEAPASRIKGTRCLHIRNTERRFTLMILSHCSAVVLREGRGEIDTGAVIH